MDYNVGISASIIIQELNNVLTNISLKKPVVRINKFKEMDSLVLVNAGNSWSSGILISEDGCNNFYY